MGKRWISQDAGYVGFLQGRASGGNATPERETSLFLQLRCCRLAAGPGRLPLLSFPLAQLSPHGQ